jgi:hypothetical protein
LQQGDTTDEACSLHCPASAIFRRSSSCFLSASRFFFSSDLLSCPFSICSLSAASAVFFFTLQTGYLLSTPWEKCNNCTQLFQNQVALDLSSAFISFAEEAYNFLGNGKWDKVKVMSSLRCKIQMLLDMMCSNSPRGDEGNIKVECEMLIKKLLSMVDQTKKDLKMSSWLHMPPTSDECQ